MTANEIRSRLRTQSRRKGKAQKEVGEADARIAGLLREVQKTEGIEVAEAAAILGISRNMAYKMLRR